MFGWRAPRHDDRRQQRPSWRDIGDQLQADQIKELGPANVHVTPRTRAGLVAGSTSRTTSVQIRAEQTPPGGGAIRSGS